jgi:hypothetical protein
MGEGDMLKYWTPPAQPLTRLPEYDPFFKRAYNK